MAGRLEGAAMKTQKQVEAIEDTLIDTIAKLTEDGHHSQADRGWAPGDPRSGNHAGIAGCTHYDGAKALARMFRHLADECERCADAAMEEGATD